MTDPRQDLWEKNALWWQENFTQGVDPEYEEQIIPLLGRHLDQAHKVLDIGTGDGQLTRVIKSYQSSNYNPQNLIIGIDPTDTLLKRASSLDNKINYVRGLAELLPFVDASFDTAIACLVFEHIDYFEEAILEISRVLEPGGSFLFFLNHPIMQSPGSGWIEDHILQENYFRIGPYLESSSIVEEVDKGIFIPFIHRPISLYVNALINSNLRIDSMQEPPPPVGFINKAFEYNNVDKIPRLLFIKATKLKI